MNQTCISRCATNKNIMIKHPVCSCILCGPAGNFCSISLVFYIYLSISNSNIQLGFNCLFVVGFLQQAKISRKSGLINCKENSSSRILFNFSLTMILISQTNKLMRKKNLFLIFASQNKYPQIEAHSFQNFKSYTFVLLVDNNLTPS